MKSMASISRTPIPIYNYLSSFIEISRALPISPLAATDPFGWWGHYLFTPDHDSGISLATYSYILLCIEFNQGNVYLIPTQGCLQKKKYQSAQYFYKLSKLSYSSEFQSFFAYDNDLILLIPKTKRYCCRMFTSLQYSYINATQTSSSLRSSAMTFRCIVRTAPVESWQWCSRPVYKWQGMQLLFRIKQWSLLPLNANQCL